jgi:hypothetical protein
LREGKDQDCAAKAGILVLEAHKLTMEVCTAQLR